MPFFFWHSVTAAEATLRQPSSACFLVWKVSNKRVRSLVHFSLVYFYASVMMEPGEQHVLQSANPIFYHNCWLLLLLHQTLSYVPCAEGMDLRRLKGCCSSSAHAPLLQCSGFNSQQLPGSFTTRHHSSSRASDIFF